MAITTLELHFTRSKRVSNGSEVNGNGLMEKSSKTSATATTRRTTDSKISMKSKATIKSTILDIKYATKIIRSSRTALTFDASLQTQSDITGNDTNAANNEKENIDPLTGLESLETLALKSGKRKGLGVIGRGVNVFAEESSHVKGAKIKTIKTVKTTSHARKPRVSGSVQEENDMDTITGRLVAMRRREPREDRIARELTVRSLLDLSEAYGIEKAIPPKEIAIGEQEQGTQEINADDDEEPSAHVLIAADLHAAFCLLAQTTDEHRCLPTALQCLARNAKRQAIDFAATSCPPRESTSSETPATRELRQLGQPKFSSSSLSRPTKCMRKSAPGTATPKITTMPDIDATSILRVPPNGPVRTAHSLPSATKEVPAATSAPIDIPAPRHCTGEGRSVTTTWK